MASPRVWLRYGCYTVGHSPTCRLKELEERSETRRHRLRQIFVLDPSLCPIANSQAVGPCCNRLESGFLHAHRGCPIRTYQLTLSRKGAVRDVSVEVAPAAETTGKVYSRRQQ
jgi:hypothetical protein